MMEPGGGCIPETWGMPRTQGQNCLQLTVIGNSTFLLNTHSQPPSTFFLNYCFRPHLALTVYYLQTELYTFHILKAFIILWEWWGAESACVEVRVGCLLPLLCGLWGLIELGSSGLQSRHIHLLSHLTGSQSHIFYIIHNS